MRDARGFTLVELLCCVLIAAVLAASALPGYRSILQRARRSDAQISLMRVAAAQERFFLQHHRYADRLSLPAPDGLGMTALSEHGHYLLEVQPALSGAGFRVLAMPSGTSTQLDDRRCRGFALDETGRREAWGDGADPARTCWR